MCGIAGYVTAGSPRSFESFQSTVLETLKHRGPDDTGWLVDGSMGQGNPPEAAGRVGLFHRRLSILDLSPLGHQPMATPDGRYALTFNGEIYNYRELRHELEKDGYQFRSQSDSEILLHLFARSGPAALKQLVGMFAFAFLDRQTRRLTLVRDFFGIKPVYYAHSAKGFGFASEIKALRPLVSGRVQPHRLFDYLRDGRTDHGGSTLLADIQQLPAAHWLQVELDTAQVSEPKRYWDIDLNHRIDCSFDEAVARAREQFIDSVRLHLRSDVPVGAALSGGIDSSAIVAAMRAIEPTADLRSFSYIAAGDLSEEKYADIASSAAGATPQKVRLGPEDLAADLDRLIATQDEPFGSTSIYAQYRVFRLAAENGVKVMLDGQGADEMLAGYPGFLGSRLATLLRQGNILAAYKLANSASQRPGIGNRFGLLARGLRRLLPASIQHMGMNRLGQKAVPQYLNATWFAEHGVEAAWGSIAPRNRSFLRQHLHDTLTTSSLPMLLRYEDRNSMAWSIESRVPFLTPGLAELFLALPESYLLSPSGTTKHVFREAMRGLVPDAILDRRDKVGFATPEFDWLRTLEPWISQLLKPDRLSVIPVLNAKQVMDDWQNVLARKNPFDWRIWRWVNLIRWAEINQVDLSL